MSVKKYRKKPVDPRIMYLMRRKRESGIKLTIWAVSGVLALAAWVAVLVVSYRLGDGEVLFVTAFFTVGLAALLGSMGIAYFEPDNPIDDYLSYDSRLKALQNELAWDAQQEELQRLRNIMKEEGL